MPTVGTSSFLNVIILDKIPICLGFGLLVEQNKTFEDVTMTSKLQLIKKIICRLIYLKTITSCSPDTYNLKCFLKLLSREPSVNRVIG